ncbi:hypothetical protein [Gemmatimonas groenlandica]|uniref:Lipoprotein n=1 Tax=Gemmatimonas groenlandica TaxID=2732249 RepID=A0A6M4IPE6_9BACT|nr:hypothetical protein [Gemmatimonas groenlandica]QJR34141.1 hypothetical protein HKW67_00730 [Gemmatimonas groenlandica]
MRQLPRTTAQRLATLLVTAGATVLLLGGCRAAALAYGPDIASAKANADALAAAIEARFTNVARNPKFSAARMRIARYAFAPSKLGSDTSLWTSMRTTRAGADLDLEIQAGLSGAQYVFTARPGVPMPVRTGDSRHLIELEQLGESDWAWRTRVDHAVGAMPPNRADDIFRALFLSSERSAAAVRADYHAALPRTTAALGRLLTIDSIATAPQGDGSTLVTLQITVSGDRLKRGFPAFAKYISKYVEPARYRYRLTDRSGSDWFDAEARNQLLTVRFRSHDGQLQPLLGSARRMPDTLQIHVDALAKISFFTVGVTNMQGEFVHTKTARERGWAMHFTKDPEWHLPLITERLLRSPLRRPFEGKGVLFTLGFRMGPEGQTLLTREFDVTVRESAIMRFIGNLGFTAMSDYAGKVEEEESRFISESMAAFRADVAALTAK